MQAKESKLVFNNNPLPIQAMIRMFNTNIDGKKQIIKALTTIRGIGDRLSLAILRRAKIPTDKRAGELTEDELNEINEVILNPQKYDIPEWMLNHQNDPIDGTTKHLIGNQIEGTIRLWNERGKKIGLVRAFRTSLGLKVRGQRTKSNGRGGRTMGVSRKK
ncbi:40S ribosomal protein S18 [Spraguea lophii 42_110]|uniref:40S ribosomal protein S18 n=1 Tax=Spraguea lophii (strain 42_110) TaxID=1358809 RepID=S7XJA1_SPRLO|nr:Chain SS0, 40S ribosomal protein S18 [Spraguea lophii 42_110]7QJH_RS0 Chain RS0, 40S ribosomal protein S18 [Spraguea lophii 42_110]7QJH_SS0 Chain SS0, 40S ribosomal protein S18 [Spraguea lophii 42_110]8BR3_SS0 Chain SS0, 40S ribosomal protein S18 [Spraguea lophii 42_110]8P5D_SS0 Chain SS0, 40S ribosomal protein S18 [Spraguea lophii 42_110]8P60_RS0 Chain RS0, 40S ribosomal protein S18 [Spraguea lophii 42_110]8P60_SS0 Chain SS0, 40S ribosomal protein S18 [Spraguea lophii 42_110]EPR79099.1 4